VKLTVAMMPLSGRGLVLMMPIRTVPGELVLTAVKAPAVKAPWLTRGLDQATVS
jgi:hypothetical protein